MLKTTTESTSGMPNRPLEWGAKAIMLCGGLMVALALSAITSVLPQIEADLAHSPQDSLLIKQLVGIVGLAMVVGAPLAGFLVDRIGARRVVITACLLYAAIGTAGLYLTSLPALIASRLLLGIAAVAITTTAMTMINTRLTGIERAKWMGAHVAVAMVGSILINPIAGYLGEFGWRWPFALYAIGIPFALLALGLDRQVVQRARSPAATSPEPRLLTWFPVRYAVLAVFIGSITYLPMVYLPFLMRQMGITSPTIISLVLTGDVALGAGMALLYGRSRRYFSIYVGLCLQFCLRRHWHVRGCDRLEPRGRGDGHDDLRYRTRLVCSEPDDGGVAAGPARTARPRHWPREGCSPSRRAAVHCDRRAASPAAGPGRRDDGRVGRCAFFADPHELPDRRRASTCASRRAGGAQRLICLRNRRRLLAAGKRPAAWYVPGESPALLQLNLVELGGVRAEDLDPFFCRQPAQATFQIVDGIKSRRVREVGFE